MEKIQKASHRFRILFQTIFYFTPIVIAIFWLNFNWFYSLMPAINISINEPGLTATFANGLPLDIRLGAFLVSLLPAGIFMLGIHHLIKLFRLYEQGKLFTLQNALYIRQLGLSFFVWVLIGFPYEALLSFIVSLHNQPGKHLISIGFSSPDITAMITGALVLLLAWIMQEGYKLQEEHTYTV